MYKYNYVLIFKDGIVPELPSSERTIIIHESAQGWKCAKGSWNEDEIKDFEYYPAIDDWQTQSKWEDILL